MFLVPAVRNSKMEVINWVKTQFWCFIVQMGLAAKMYENTGSGYFKGLFCELGGGSPYSTQTQFLDERRKDLRGSLTYLRQADTEPLFQFGFWAGWGRRFRSSFGRCCAGRWRRLLHLRNYCFWQCWKRGLCLRIEHDSYTRSIQCNPPIGWQKKGRK